MTLTSLCKSTFLVGGIAYLIRLPWIIDVCRCGVKLDPHSTVPIYTYIRYLLRGPLFPLTTTSKFCESKDSGFRRRQALGLFSLHMQLEHKIRLLREWRT